MKSYINKILAGVALTAMVGMTACVDDLNQLPQDPNSDSAANFNKNPKEYIGEVMAKCYSSLAVGGQTGLGGDADIKGMDGGTSQWSRTVFMLEEFPTDECIWIYEDAGVPELRSSTWGSANVLLFGTYSRLYTHIAVCNDFLRLTADLGTYGINPDAALQKDIDQFNLEARALRGLSYYYVINFFGNGVLAWDDMAYGEIPQQVTRKELFNKVTADLEDVVAKFQDSNVYGRVGKDGVEALLCRYYLNAEVFTGTAMYDKCWEHCQNIIGRHKGKGFEGSGLANDYLALFGNNNQMFGPGGSLTDQNEILWLIPQNTTYTQAYGGSTFLVKGGIKNMSAANEDILNGDAKVSDGYMNQTYYGSMDAWGCMHARPQLADKFQIGQDDRTYLWLTENAGFIKENIPMAEFQSGYACVKYTACNAKADGTMPRFVDPVTGLNRIGVAEISDVKYTDAAGVERTYVTYTIPDLKDYYDTSVPVIRLADVYLMAAEAALRGAGNTNDALTYVNYIRHRAGVSSWTIADLTLSSLLDERARELYWESVRRTDLVRFGRFAGSSYLWAWKGGVETGTALPAHFNIYPLPSDVLATYGSSMIQNPGY